MFNVGNGNSSSNNSAFKIMGNGDVNVNNLPGSGGRNVKVTADGSLYAEASNVYFYAVAPTDFVALNSKNLIQEQFFVRGNNNNAIIYAPVHLPHNAIIKEIIYWYYDNNTTVNFFAQLNRISLNSTTSQGVHNQFDSSTTASTNLQQRVFSNLSFSVDNSVESLQIRISPRGDDWDSNIYVKSVLTRCVFK